MDRVYEEEFENGVKSVVTVSESEIRYTVTKNGEIHFNEAIVGRYSTRRAAQLNREQYEVATRLAR